MTDSQDKITLDQVKEVARVVVEENPNAINPRIGGGVCAYTREANDDTPNAAEHCLGGTILLRLGAALPDERRPVQETPNSDRFAPMALMYLGALQYEADSKNTDGLEIRSRTWSEAYAIVENDKMRKGTV